MFTEGKKNNEIKSMCLVDYANFLYHKKGIDKAIVFFNKAIVLNTNNFYAYSGLAGALIQKKQFKQALESCNNANLIKQDVLIYLMQIISYRSLGENVLADEVHQKALKLYDNDLADLYYGLAFTYYKFNMLEEAELFCKEVIKIYPQKPGIYFNLANIYLAKKQYAMAKKELERSLELSNDNKYKRSAKREIKKIKREAKRSGNGQGISL